MPASSSAPGERRGGRPSLRRLLLGAAPVVVLAILVAVVLWMRPDLFVRGPAVDASTRYLAALQRDDYVAAYQLLAPDLRARESENDFAAAMQAIAATDGRLTSYQVRSMQADAGREVVTLALSRSIRGNFTGHIELSRDAGGTWLVSGADDL